MTRMSMRQRAMSTTSRKQELVDVPEWLEGDDPIAPDGVIVRELSVAQRMNVMAGMKVNAGTQEASVDLSLLAPFIVDLILDPASGERAYEDADRDTLLDRHPGACSRILMTSFNLSDFGESAVARAEGNSDPVPNSETASPLQALLG